MSRVAVLLLLLLLGAVAASAQSVPVPQKRPAAETQAPLPPPVETPVMPVAPHREACAALRSGLVEGRQGAAILEGACGIDAPVLATVAGGIKLATPATLTCGMATTLAQFLPQADSIAKQMLGSGLVSVEAGAGYECRNRNRAASGKLSEHAFANAFDVTAFVLADGRKIKVADGWPHLLSLPAAGEKPPAPSTRATTPQARFLAAVHSAACSRFSTVLGPDENAEHREHFHFDLGCHGKDCTYLICN